MARILLVDDHDAMRSRLRTMILSREDWEVCGEAANGLDAAAMHSALLPCLTIMDFSMPVLDGLNASRLILRNHPSACILILSAHESPQLMDQVKKAGVKGFCFKQAMGNLFEVAEKLLRGETHFAVLAN